MIQDDQEAARQAAAGDLSVLDLRIMRIRVQQMLERLQKWRRSEERSLGRAGEPEVEAAELNYRNMLTEREAMLDQLGNALSFDRCRYVGGYRHLPNPIDPVVLWFDSNLQIAYLNATNRPELATAVDAMPIP